MSDRILAAAALAIVAAVALGPHVTAAAGQASGLVMGLVEDQLEAKQADLADVHRPFLAMRPVLRKAELLDVEAQRTLGVRDEEDGPRVKVDRAHGTASYNGVIEHSRIEMVLPKHGPTDAVDSMPE